MTSIPASRRARAMTLAPRSWPSSPGLAIITRIFCTGTYSPATRNRLNSSDYRRFFVFAPDVPERVAHFSYGGVCAHRVDEERHGVGRRAGPLLQRLERAMHVGVVARLTQLIELRKLLLRCGLVDVQGPNWLLVVRHELVHADDDLVALLDGLLEFVRAIGDFTLRITLFNGGDHPAHAIDRVEVRQRLLFEVGGQLLDEVGPAQRVDHVRYAGFVRDDLLRPQRQRRRFL